MKYLCFYDNEINKDEDRIMALSAATKINYIVSVICKFTEVEIISPSWTNHKKGFFKSKKYSIDEKTSVRLFASFGANNRITKKIRYLYSLFQTFIYIIFNTKKDEPVLLYHSIAMIKIVKIAKIIKKFKLILELEEIYGDVTESNKTIKKELNFCKLADAFIFSTILLNDKINKNNKPFVVVLGTYKIEKNKNVSFNDDKIHIVYAGTFDPLKGGVLISVEISKFLNEKYHLHILGFGNDNEKQNIISLINNISKQTKCKITFDGLKSGDEYIEFIQKCQIGLSTQNPNAKFNDTSFPSKILSYMSNGLRVVSVKIKAIEQSEVSECLYYYEKQTPKNIADVIMKIDINDNYNGREKINFLAENFDKNLYNMLKIFLPL